MTRTAQTPSSGKISTSTGRSTSATPQKYQYPGGTAGKDLLSQHHWLDEQGRLSFGETAPKDRKIQHAFCDYLFGTVDEVAELGNLPGTVTLDEVSGYKNFGANGTPFVCVYDADGTELLALQVTNGPTVDASSPGRPIVVTDGDLQAVFSYAPDYSGTRLAKRLATEWITQAVGLVSH